MSLSRDGGLDELDVNSSNWDILKEIDKFLEGYSSDGEELPVKNNNELDEEILPVHIKKNELCISKTINEINTSNCVVENITKPIDVEFVGKKPAVFELLEDHEEYAVYEHNPDEANWNVFYKTLPPGEQHRSIKQEPGTEDVKGCFNQNNSTSECNSENELKNFSFDLDNLPTQNIKLEPLGTEADTLNKINSPLHFYEAFNSEEDTLFKEKAGETFLNSSSASYDTTGNNPLENFSFLSGFDCQESNHSKYDPFPTEICLQNQETYISEKNSYTDILTSSVAREDISKSKIELKNFSFSLDNINKFQNPINFQPENCNFNLQSKDYIKSKNYKTWAPFKQYNHSDYRDENLVRDFQYNNWKPKNKSFMPRQYQKNFNKFQPDRSRGYKQSRNKEKDYNNQPMNTVRKRNNHFSQNNNKLFESYKQNSNKFESNYTEKKLPKIIKKFQRPPVTMKPTSFKSWNSRVSSTQHNSDDFETRNVDEKNFNSQFLNIPNGDHTYKHGYTAAEPYMKNISMKNSEIRNHSDTDFTKIGKKSNKGFDEGEIVEDEEEFSPKQTTDFIRGYNFNKSEHIISDYLSPESLVGCTIKFSSRKLANTLTRDQLIEALATYGQIENSWWTPDDFFFVTYSSRKVAKHVYDIYPKNVSSSY